MGAVWKALRYCVHAGSFEGFLFKVLPRSVNLSSRVGSWVEGLLVVMESDELKLVSGDWRLFLVHLQLSGLFLSD